MALEWRRGLRANGGRLEHGPGPGAEVHAASFVRARRLVLDADLRRRREELARIVIHELFHFVWLRLGNPLRDSWGRLIGTQCGPGELGWSAEWRKERLRAQGFPAGSRLWREYACESFCDTAAWIYCGLERHEEFTLPRLERAGRRGWFQALLRHRGGVYRI